MKRFLSFLTALAVLAPLAHAQAPAVNNYPEMSVIARFDYPVLPYVYTLLEGDLGEHFSYSVCNHWLNDDPASLYQNTWHSDSLDWCDWANVTASFGNWSFTLGKDCMAIGTFEEDAYDFDSYWELSSTFWNNFVAYQWGGKVAYTTPSENTTFALQLSSSPFDIKPFETGLKAVNLKWTGEYGIYSPIWSVNTVQFGKGGSENLNLFMFGNQLAISESVSFAFDWIYRIGGASRTAPGASADSEKYCDNEGHTLTFAVNADICDHLSIMAKYGFENAKGIKDDLLEIPDKYEFGGLCLQYYPLRNSQDLRIHALAAANRFDRPEMMGNDWEFTFSAGITYNFSLSDLIFNR